EPARASARKLVRSKGSEDADAAGRRYLDDARPRALQVPVVVEVADQHVSRCQPPGRRRHDGDAVRVDVAVLRYGRREGLAVVERVDEGACRSCRRRRCKRERGYATSKCERCRTLSSAGACALGHVTSLPTCRDEFLYAPASRPVLGHPPGRTLMAG